MPRSKKNREQLLAMDWITASSAYRIMCEAHNNPVIAGQILAQHLRDGRIKARAKAIWKSEENLLSKAWKSRPEYDKKFKRIKKVYWRSHKNWPDDRDSWVWTNSRLYVTTRNIPIQRRLMVGVRLYVEDLKEAMPIEFGKPKRKRGGGPPPDIQKRTLAWGVLLEMAVKNELYEKWLDLPQEDLVIHVFETLKIRGTPVGEDLIKQTVMAALEVLTRLRDDCEA